METSPRSSSSSTSSSGSHSATLTATTSATPLLHSPKPITRSDSNNPCPTTFVQADSSSFKQVVQMLTGSPKPTNVTDSNPNLTSKPHSHNYNIPPIKSIPKKNQSSSGFKLSERRKSLKNLRINPIFNLQSSGFSPRKPEILSPSLLDLQALVLSPVTPLIPDPFDRSGLASNNNNTCFSLLSANNHNNNRSNGVKCDSSIGSLDCDAEDRAIKEKGFFLHPSPREAEPPRLLPLFPVTSPRVSGSADS